MAELSIYARFIFPGLWTLADVEGRMEDRPKRIKAELLPYDAQDIDALLWELHNAGFIVRYEAGGESYIWIPKFRDHQRITGREAESESRFPAPPSNPSPPSPQGTTREEPESPGKQQGITGETLGTTGREGKGKESNTEAKASGAEAPAAEKQARRGRDPSVSPSHAYDPVHRVLCQVHEALGWKPPTPADVATGLKPASQIETLISDFGEDGARDLFLFAHETWDKKPTWPAVFRQRNQLWEQMQVSTKVLYLPGFGIEEAS